MKAEAELSEGFTKVERGRKRGPWMDAQRLVLNHSGPVGLLTPPSPALKDTAVLILLD